MNPIIILVYLEMMQCIVCCCMVIRYRSLGCHIWGPSFLCGNMFAKSRALFFGCCETFFFRLCTTWKTMQVHRTPIILLASTYTLERIHMKSQEHLFWLSCISQLSSIVCNVSLIEFVSAYVERSELYCQPYDYLSTNIQ